jgi:DNA-binding response OmpR family regulator
MANNEEVHVLYVAHGRLALSKHEALQNALNTVHAGFARQETLSLVLTLVTSQKAAMLAGRYHAPAIAVIELKQLAQRIAFCNQLIHRWPTVRMVAVTNNSLVGAPVHFEQTIPHPLSPPTLQAALNTMLQQAVNERTVQAGDVILDLQNRTVITPKGQHHMTPKQCALLQMLMIRCGEVVSRREIMQDIWQTNFLGDTRTLDVHIRWLREYIESDPSNPRYLITVRGRGYRFCAR